MARHVEIAGGGFAGLTAAIAFRRRGWSVRLHERGETLRPVGAGIFLWHNSLEILKEFGLYDELRAQSHRPPFYETRVHNHPMSKEYEGLDYLTMSRAHLHGVLARGAEEAGAEILTSSHVVGADASGSLRLETGETFEADLVVGADGVNSKVRDSMGFAFEQWGSRDSIARVLIPRDPEYIGGDWDNVIDMWNFAPRVMRILYVPCNDRELYLGLMAPNEDPQAVQMPIDLGAWVEMFPHLETALKRVAKLTDARRDTYETRVLERWTDGKVALVGDSAHAMCPALAQGAGCGMVNAYTLAERVADSAEAGLPQLLVDWEHEVRPLTDRCQERSRLLMESRAMSCGNQWDADRLETSHFDPVAAMREARA